MTSASDLIDHFKLDAQRFPDYTLQTSYTSEPARGLRKVVVRKKWYRDKAIGHGTFGTVWLEVDQGEGEIAAKRAVKEILKARMQEFKVDYRRELLALAKLSKV